ncbi:MAG: CpsD/CapB family tyrosine-protein kinase [Vicinamibacterales bacterium]
MSRIDQALNRARVSVPPERTENNPEAFVSPWAVEGARSEAPPAPKRHVERRQPLHEVNGRSVDPAPALDASQFHREWRQRLTIWRKADPWLVEQYRALVASMIERQAERRLKTVMITSPDPDDGKTLTSLNLALVLSESYRHSVLLIDADMRRPSIGQIAGLTSNGGLNEAIRPGEDALVAPVPLTDGLSLLLANPDPDPVSGLASNRMQQLLDEAMARFDWVIVDSPPVGIVTDAGLLSAMVDATILVVRAEQTPLESVQHAVETIGRERILGVVLNAVREHTAASRGYYYAPQQARRSPSGLPMNRRAGV